MFYISKIGVNLMVPLMIRISRLWILMSFVKLLFAVVAYAGAPYSSTDWKNLDQIVDEQQKRCGRDNFTLRFSMFYSSLPSLDGVQLNTCCSVPKKILNQLEVVAFVFIPCKFQKQSIRPDFAVGILQINANCQHMFLV